MSDDPIETKPTTKFTKGKSGNPRGRPKKSEKIPHPESFRDRVFAIAEFRVPTNLAGKAQKLSLYEVNVLNLGLKGAKGNMRASEKFLEQIDLSLEQELRYMREAIKGIQSVEPDWLTEPDPVLRDLKKKRWDYALQAATGRRERSTPHFPPPKRPRRG